MKIIINESHLERIFNKFMTDEFNKLTKFKSKIFPIGSFYINKDGKIIAEVIKTKHAHAVVFDWEMWIFIDRFFDFETIPKKQELLSKWADEYFDLTDSLIDFRDFVETIDDL